MKLLVTLFSALLLCGCTGYSENSIRSQEEREVYRKALEHQENKVMDAIIFDGVPVYSSGAMD